MWSAFSSFFTGAQVRRSPEMQRVHDFLATWSFGIPGIPEPYNLVVCPDGGGCLYLGNLMAYTDREFMNQMGAVVTVIDSGSYPLSYFRDKVPPTAAHLYIDAHDDTDTNLAQYFGMVYRFIDSHLRQGQDVFVHCAVGKSRSATLVVHYLMRKYRLSLLQALQYLRSRRPIVRPNDAFLEQLERG